MTLDIDTGTKRMGRPRGSKNKKVVVTRQEFEGDDDDTEPDDSNTEDSHKLPLFETGKLADKSITKIRVTRREPDEGMLGYLDDLNATEAAISERWGGGVYRLEAVNARYAVQGVATIKIAGDPIFASESAAIQWRKAKGLPAHSSAAAIDKGMSFQEMLAFIQTQESERSQRQREHDAAMRKIELEAEDRKRRDDEERERRRNREDEEREARRRREQEEAMLRQQQFMQQTIQMIQQSSNQALQFVKATAEGTPKEGGANSLLETVKVVMAIKDAFGGGDGGDEPQDPLSLVIKHGGDWLNGIGNAVTGAIREVKGGGLTGQGTAQPQLPAVQSPAVSLPFGGPLADKIGTLVTKIAARGQDPEVVLNKIVDNLLTVADRPQAPTAQTQAPIAGSIVTPQAQATPTGVVDKIAKKVARLQFGQARKVA